MTEFFFRKTPNKSGFFLVGKTGFEPATTWSQTRYATGLRYFPSYSSILMRWRIKLRKILLRPSRSQSGYATGLRYFPNYYPEVLFSGAAKIAFRL